MAASLQAATLNSNFTADPGGVLLGKAKLDAGVLKLQDLQDLVDGTAALPLHGSYIFPQIDSEKVASFNAKFKASIHGGTDTAAQGFSLVLANDLDANTPFREGGGTADGGGFTQGLVISFDTLDNTGVFGANGNDPGDAPGIIVKIGGQRVAAKKFAGLRTGKANDQTPVFVPVEVNLDADGTLDVSYNGTKVFDNFGIPYAPISGSFGFGAGTAENTASLRANHWIDDLSITTSTVTAGPLLVSALPLGTSVRPDAQVQIQIQNLGGASASLKFDDQAVASLSSTAGGVTTISFDPPGVLASGSSHTVALSYGGKNITWSFSVMNATVIPASFATPTANVDTTKSGFSIRTHQLETAPATTSIQRAEDQLAGNLGANVADLTGATGGIFVKPLVNFDQSGGDAGLLNSNTGQQDDLIPGIPGQTGSDDFIAMEVTGYLELTKGVYTFGLASDDNAKFSIGPDPRDVTGATLVDIAIGNSSSTILVDADGLYPFRTVWAEGGGGANLELWSITPSGTRVLLNDRSSAGHIKVYPNLKSGVQRAPFLSAAKPAPGDANVSTLPKLQLSITEESTTVTAGSIKLSLNGTPVTLAPDAVTKAGKVTSISYAVPQHLNPKSEQKVSLSFTDSAGKSVTRDYAFTTGNRRGAGFSGGQWDFDGGNLAATLGRDLHLIDDSLTSRYKVGPASSFGIPLIGGKDVNVLRIPHVASDDADAKGAVFKRIGLRVQHNIAPNGGGKKLNQYTIIADLLWGPEGTGFGGVLQTHDFANPTDGDMFWRASDGSYGKGCCSNYDGISQEPGKSHKRGEWARVVFSVDTTQKRFAKYVNGNLHRADVGGDGANVDGRFALPPEFFMFGDGDDNERSECFINSLQIREGALTDDEVAALGAASPDGIPIPYAQWNFDDNSLAAAAGNDLELIDNSLLSRYKVGTTASFGIAGINGQDANVLHIPHVTNDDADAKGAVFKRIGLRVKHGLGANGGGQKLNQYTLIMDVLWGTEGTGFGGVLQTHDLANPTDGDMFWRASDGSYGKGCCSNYDGISQAPGKSHKRGEWARIVFSVDTTQKRFAKYVNGNLHRADVGGDGANIDGRFALPSEFFMFGDGDDNERSEVYVNSIQIRAGALTDEEVAALGSASAPGIPSPNPVKGDWDLQGDYKAFIGQDLGLIDSSLASRYKFGPASSFSIPGIEGSDVTVLHIPYMPSDDADAKGAVFKRIGLRVNHGVPPNGGGTKANQWTLIADILWGSEGTGFGGLLQTHDFANPTDGDLFWRASDGSYGKGCCSNYDGISQEAGKNHKRGEWARIVISVDTTQKRFAKYVNGNLHRADVGGDGANIDGRFALPPEIYLFGDGDDNERAQAFVSALQFREGALTDDEVAALGGPSAYGIPGASAGGAPAAAPQPVTPPKFTVARNAAGAVILSWTSTAAFTLESKASLSDATWTPVAGVANNSITISPTDAARFYRLRK